MPFLTTRVEPEIKTRFRTTAKVRGLSESELLRAAILAVTSQDKRTNQPLESGAGKYDLDRMTVRMPRFVKEATKKRAKAKGMAPSRWITALVQSNLTGQPVMADAELAELHASSRELAAIGRNINQIAKALNKGFYETERDRLDRLDALGKAITENRAAIRALVRACQNVWEAD